MSLSPTRQGLFIAEGSSDEPLADIVENLFFDRGIEITLSRPDLGLLPVRKVGKDVRSKIGAGLRLVSTPVDVLVVHRDADAAGWAAREAEIRTATHENDVSAALVPVVPVRMTESWLLLDERAIRSVAGNPNGKQPLALPKHHQIERIADPKSVLQELLLTAADVTGRRRDRVVRRFDEHRRQLLGTLDPVGAVTRLSSWQQLVACIDAAADALT